MNVVNLAIDGNLTKYNETLKKRKPSKLEKYGYNDKTKIAISSFAGSTIGILAILRVILSQARDINPNVFIRNLKYEESDIVAIGASSIIGGIMGGCYIDKNKDNRIAKIREGLMQFFGNLACPLTILHFANKALAEAHIRMPNFKENFKYSQEINKVINASPKIAVTAASLYAGMHIGNSIMNDVNNFIFDKKEEREVHTEDYFVHVDDVCIAGSLLLNDNRNMTNLISKALPASFVIAGTKSGIQHS